MINLAGYSVQGNDGREETEGALVYPNGYSGAVSFDFAETFPDFKPTGYTQTDDIRAGVGKVEQQADGYHFLVYAPVKFCYGIQELDPPANWKSTITRIYDENGITVNKEPEAIHMYFVYCARGETTGGRWYDQGVGDVTPWPCFQTNDNYVANLNRLRKWLIDDLLSKKFGKGEAIYKLNGRYGATGAPKGGILNGLKKYNEGYCLVGWTNNTTALAVKAQDVGFLPHFTPINNLSLPVSPFNITVTMHNGGAVPCNRTEAGWLNLSAPMTSGTCGFDASTGRIVTELQGITSTLDISNIFMRTPLREDVVFSGYQSNDVSAPRYSYGFIFTSEAL